MRSVLFAILFTAVASAAQAQDRMIWYSFTGPDDGRIALNYGIPEGDTQMIGFSCKPRSGRISAGASFRRTLGVTQSSGRWLDKSGAREPWPVKLSLQWRSRSATVDGEGYFDEPAGSGTSVGGELSSRELVMIAFAASGRIEAKALGQTVKPPLADKAMVRRFFDACG